MKLSMRVAVAFTAALPAAIFAQDKKIPVRAVAPLVISTERFTLPPTVRQLPEGRVLVNDQRGKRLLVFDSTLSTFTVSADSSGSNGLTYPYTGQRAPLIPYLGDSTLFIDYQARTFLMVDPKGNIGRAVAHPYTPDLFAASVPYAGLPSIDHEGRLIYRATTGGRPEPRPGEPPITATRDTIKIVRADFNTRTVDTIASFGVPRNTRPVITEVGGKFVGTMKINPLPPAPDDWVVLSDGALAVVREHDYHIDWLNPDGTKSSSPKMPFDWKQLTDADKLARIDSMKKVIDSVVASGRPYAMIIRGRAGSERPDTIISTITFSPLADIPDYISPIRQGVSTADRDANLWILPTTSSQAGTGLLYDVVNRKGELFERVRLPANCVLVGFGRGGVMYLARNDTQTKTWALVRTRVVR